MFKKELINFVYLYGKDKNGYSLLIDKNITKKYNTWLKGKFNSNIMLDILIDKCFQIECNDKHLNFIPDLNILDNCKIIELNDNFLSNIPLLPKNVERLNISNNEIKEIKNLPNNIISLDISKNYIKKINNLPENLEILNVNSNQLIDILYLPYNLKRFACYNNLITSLPTLPNSLEYLNIGKNLFINIPRLPDKLKTFLCTDSKIEVKSIENEPNYFKKLIKSQYDFKNNESILYNNFVINKIYFIIDELKYSNSNTKKRLLNDLKHYLIYAKKNSIDINNFTDIIKSI